MTTVILKIKLMPESPDTDLNKIKEEANTLLIKEGGKNISFEEKPVAFGLKALMVKTDLPEEKGTDMVETAFAKIPGVSSVTIEDYRRAFG